MRSLPLVAFLMAVWMVSLGSAWDNPVKLNVRENGPPPAKQVSSWEAPQDDWQFEDSACLGGGCPTNCQTPHRKGTITNELEWPCCMDGDCEGELLDVDYSTLGCLPSQGMSTGATTGFWRQESCANVLICPLDCCGCSCVSVPIPQCTHTPLFGKEFCRNCDCG